MLFCKKKCSYEFCKIHKKIPALEPRFKRSCISTEFNFIKERDSGICLLANYVKFLIRPFLKNPFDGCFCINTFRLFKNDVTHILAEYFFGLIWKLGTRVNSIFQSLSLKSIFNPFKYLRCSILAKIVNSWYCYDQKQSSGPVLQKRRSYKFFEIQKKTPALEPR